jgi:uncharacterized protein YigA (DUF484 family)
MSKEIKTDVSIKQVRGFLRDHPTFLDENPDILETMIVNHKPGGAVSLVERQLAALRERNALLVHQLDSLVVIAKDNELMFDKTRRLVVNLLDTNSLASVVEALYDSLGTDFGVSSFSVSLFVNKNCLENSMARVTSLEDATEQVPNIINATAPVCGTLRNEENIFLFGKAQDNIGSVAAILLGKTTKLGILALGNPSPDFYNSKMGTLFLEHIGDILNRLLPLYIKK